MKWQRAMRIYPPAHDAWDRSNIGSGHRHHPGYNALYDQVARRGSHMLRYTIGWDKDWPGSLVYRGEPNG